jgi:hypothetical protein
MTKFYNFLEKANKIHNEFYNYDKVNYINARTKITIVCPIHGDFEQLPFNHLKGKGCKICGIEKVKEKLSKTSEFFIKEIKEIYGNTYDYSLVDYKNDKSSVKIICKKHGIFEKRPTDLLYGRHCNDCELKIKKRIIKEDKNTNFIEKCRSVWFNKYDYSLVEYINSKLTVKIICKKHGIFDQTPNTHLRGSGCPKCKKINKLDFLEKIPHRFKEIYNYEDLNIKSTRQNIELVCKKHGKFKVLIFSHMKGTHCKKCKSSSGEELIIEFLESNNIKYNYQHSFNNCFYKRSLKFDFYIEDKNTCIEYDGEQHFGPVNIFGGEESFNIQKKLDNIKNNFCKENDIKLIRIPYFEKENINDILSFLI